MNRLAALAAFATVSSISFAGVSYADSLTMNSGPSIETTLLSYSKPFAVRYLDNYDNSKFDDTTGVDAEAPRSNGGIQHIQSSINSNKSLVEKLKTRGVDVKDIVDAEQAADGSVIFSVN
jgi:hypothetical protein